MPGLVMICPSRGRPGNVARVVSAWQATTAAARLVVVTDPDDPELEGYRALRLGQLDDVSLHVAAEPRRLGPLLNAAGPVLAETAGAVGFLSDSHLPRTPGWDRRLMDALPAGGGVSYANDLFQCERLPTTPAISAVLIRELGYMAPPVTHLYIDDFWKALGQGTALAYLPDVIVEHMHPAAGKAEWDDQWRRNNSAGQYSADQAAWESFRAGRWPADLARLREDLGMT